jgi:hypothetical protein
MDDNELFEIDLIPEFAFAATHFLYSEGGQVVCYDCDAVLAYLIDEHGMAHDAAIDYMDETMEGVRFIWIHAIDLDVELIPDDKPHLSIVPKKEDMH